jgi:hypothetical protein
MVRDALTRIFVICISVLAARLLNAVLNAYDYAPELWILGKVISVPTPEWIEAARWALALGVAVTGFLVWLLYRRVTRSKDIPISMSEARSQWYSVRVGFMEANSPDDAMGWSFGDIKITNISETKKVSLKIYLQLQRKETPERPNPLRILADGLGTGCSLKYLEQKIEKGKILPTGNPRPDIIRCPVKLGPRESVKGKLVFLQDFPEPLRVSMVMAVANNKFNYSLVIDDRISGSEVVIQLPGSYTGK